MLILKIVSSKYLAQYFIPLNNMSEEAVKIEPVMFSRRAPAYNLFADFKKFWPAVFEIEAVKTKLF